LLKNILAHGDTGLGTFNKLQGEMIILDGVIYRSTADQVISTPDIDTTQTPFAAVTKFEPEETATASFANYSDFTAQLPSWFNSSVTNHFISYRLDGHFTLRVRAPGGQNFPLEPIANVTARQTEWDFDNIEGTMVGFRTPAYAANINAAGDHLHFISADRTKGGHVLSFRSVGDVSVKAAKVDTFTVEVPRGGEYDQVILD
jgi:alpha-acetolactate decarboxylase